MVAIVSRESKSLLRFSSSRNTDRHKTSLSITSQLPTETFLTSTGQLMISCLGFIKSVRHQKFSPSLTKNASLHIFVPFALKLSLTDRIDSRPFNRAPSLFSAVQL